MREEPTKEEIQSLISEIMEVVNQLQAQDEIDELERLFKIW